MRARYAISGVLLLVVGSCAAVAAPNVPPSDQPGRERQRFLESPVQRYMQPNRQPEPLFQWQCEPRQPRGKKPKRGQGC
jgi:hypothetical protein